MELAGDLDRHHPDLLIFLTKVPMGFRAAPLRYLRESLDRTDLPADPARPTIHLLPRLRAYAVTGIEASRFGVRNIWLRHDLRGLLGGHRDGLGELLHGGVARAARHRASARSPPPAACVVLQRSATPP